MWVERVAKWKANPGGSCRIIAFGSSNTELSWSSGGRHNWVDWLYINIRAHIGQQVCVINQGIGGETTEQLLGRIERDVLSFAPEAVIVTIGGNDSSRGMKLQHFAANMRSICSRILESGAVPVLQTYYCPVYGEFEAGFRATFESFMQVNRDMAQEMGLPLIDPYRRFEPLYTSDPGEYARLMRDRLHVNALGQFVMGHYASVDLGLPGLPAPADLERDAVPLIARMGP